MPLIDLTVPPGYIAQAAREKFEPEPAPAPVVPPTPVEEPPSMAKSTKPDDKRYKTGDSQRVREYLLKLPKDKVANMSGKEYSVATGHKLKSPAVFYVEKKKLVAPGYAEAKRQRLPIPRGLPPAPQGTRFQSLAEIPLDKFKGSHQEVKEVALALVRALHPRGEEAKVVVLADPAVMEVRVPL